MLLNEHMYLPRTNTIDIENPIVPRANPLSHCDPTTSKLLHQFFLRHLLQMSARLSPFGPVGLNVRELERSPASPIVPLPTWYLPYINLYFPNVISLLTIPSVLLLILMWFSACRAAFLAPLKVLGNTVRD